MLNCLSSQFGLWVERQFNKVAALQVSIRSRGDDQLPYINTLVALFNYFSLKHMVPSGGDDLQERYRLIAVEGHSDTLGADLQRRHGLGITA